MKPAGRAADRAAEVRAAVAGWREAGLVEEATVAAAAREWPREGPAVGPVWRSLVALFTAVGAGALTAGVGMVLDISGAWALATYLLVLGVALVAATEALLDRYRFAPTGAEAATSALALLFLGIAAGIWWHEAFAPPLEGRLATGTAALLLAAAAWRWGVRLYAAGAAAAAFVLLANLPAARVLWLVAGALGALAATRALASRDLVPSHRGGLELARAVAVGAFYVAANYASVDYGAVETAVGHGVPRPGSAPAGALLAALLATVLVPLGLFAWGVRARHRGLLALGVLAAAASVATIRVYHHVAPLWVILAGCGAALAGASFLLERWLKAGPEGERSGFTAAALYHEGRREQLLPIAAAVIAAPGARELPPEPRPGIAGGGGGFGGGGAGGSF